MIQLQEKRPHLKFKIERVQTDAIKVANDANLFFEQRFQSRRRHLCCLSYLLLNTGTKKKEFVYFSLDICTQHT